jgi:thioester reductase-like protein
VGAREFQTLVELLRFRAEERPDALAYVFLENGEAPGPSLTYRELDIKARAISARLAELSTRGERALLLYPPGLDYIAAFFGCLCAGAVAVPAYPPDPARLGRSLPRLRAVAEDASISCVLSTSAIASIAIELAPQAPELGRARWIETDGLFEAADARALGRVARRDTLAFLQYTSGSTASPKGVMVSHGNLLSNLEYLERAEQNGADTVSASWLPAYHDMGLIEGILHPLYGGYPAYLMSPAAFLERPLRWLQVVSRYRVTNSGGPNFAYDLCVRKTTEAERSEVDLRPWRVAYNGAEPIREGTLRRFLEAFEPRGFRASAFYPVYGLAEATLLVSTGTRAYEPVCKSFDAARLRSGFAAEVSSSGCAAPLVACGSAWHATRVAIVDPERRSLRAEGEIGEIWVAGPGVAQGYWGRPEESARAFGARLAEAGEGPFLRTGDLGFLLGGEIFVAGRIKDCIIVRGRNHYPQDIELTVERSEASVRPGCVAAFSLGDASGEAVVVVAEVDARLLRGEDRERALASAIRAIRGAVAEQHGISLHAVTLLAARTIPKTSSGKIQRAACRAAFQAGELDVLASGGRSMREVSAPPGLGGESGDREASITAWLAREIGAHTGVAAADIDAREHVSRYGLDSLASVELVSAMASALGSSLQASALIEQPSIRALARLLARGSTSSEPRARGAGVTVNQGATGEANELQAILADAALPADIDPSRAAPPSSGEPRHILLTGATGFLGGYLLRELLAQTGARIHCLVRGGLPRMMDTLGARWLWDSRAADRVAAIEGDLRAPGFGLPSAELDQLAQEIDTIYHGAAAVNWVYPYSGLRESNVLGTTEILRLASRGARKHVHFVSTIAVCHFAGDASLSLSEEDDARSLLPAMRLGYAQSKAVAEALVYRARELGLPASIYRPSFVIGDSRSGATNTADFLSSLIKGCIQMGSAPDLEWSLDACPVDHVARSIAALSLRTRSCPMAHITNPRARPLRELVLWMSALGYPIRLVPYRRWLADLEGAAGDPSHALYYLRSFFLRRPPGDDGLTLPELYEDSRRPRVCSRRTEEALAALGIACPPLDTRLLDRTFASLIHQGFLSAPRRSRLAGARARGGDGARGSGEAPPLDAELVASMLRQSFADDSVRITATSVTPLRTEHSILTELASFGGARESGLFHYKIQHESRRGGEASGKLDIFVKVKPPDEAVLDIGRSLAAMSGERVERAYEEARELLAARGCHLRELAVYAQPERERVFSRYTPKLFGAVRDDSRGLWALALEHIGGLSLLDSADDVSGWGRAAMEAAVRGAAELHAIWYGREVELFADPILASASLARREDAARMRGFWSALAEPASAAFTPFYGEDFAMIHRELAEDVDAWWSPLEGLPRTLIHNDFNPRNIAMRSGPEGLRLCAYDWELAAVGVPQRDLAELLCFVLPPDVSAEEVAFYVDLHRVSIERARGAAIPRGACFLALRSALAELLVNRLSMYALVHAVRRQRFLPRVLASFRRLYEVSGELLARPPEPTSLDAR